MKNIKMLGLIVGLIFLTVGLLFYYKNRRHAYEPSIEEAQDILLESFYQNKLDYEESFEKISSVTKEKVTAGITSHHFLAKDLIAKFFLGIEPENIENVFVIGPDHFSSLLSKDFSIVTSASNWETPYGEILVNQEIIQQITNQEKIGIDNVVFMNEHSVYTLVPFIRKVFPEAKIVPMVLKTSKDYREFYELGKLAYRDKSLVIVSSDFSHQTSASQAKKNDAQSIHSLTQMRLEDIDSIECDCKQCIAFLYGFLTKTSVEFKLVDNKNSLDFGEQNKNNTTSYVNGYFVSN